MNRLTQSIERLNLGIAMFEAQAQPLRDEIASMEQYKRVLAETSKPTEVLNMHYRWADSQLRAARFNLRPIERRLEPLKQELTRLETIALERMKTRLTGRTPITISPAVAAPVFDRKPPRKHRKPRNYVAKGERRPQSDQADQPRKKNKDKQGKRGRKQHK